MVSSDELATRAAARADALARTRAELDALRGLGRCEAGYVEAEVDGRGELVGLHLGPGATTLPPAELGRLVVQAAQAAAGWVDERRAALLALLEGDHVADAWDAAAGRPPRA